tara:strand:+ start:21516 stop:21722 length:207 start_codon:yes stop_codon:yes gene_type:complete
MEIPHSQVPEQTLLAIIEEFISREGTDYGHREYTLAEKVEKVKSQLLNGEIKLLFDSETSSCNLVKVD